MATDVVTCFLRDPRRGEVLLLRRSDETGSYAGRWGAVSGYVEEGDAVKDAEREIREETGIEDAALVRRGEPFEVRDDELGRVWRVHPYLYDTYARDVTTNYETKETDRCSPTEILRRETVPRLWRSYASVAPSVETVAGDDEHGSAYVAGRALEVLRDSAAMGSLEEARETARELVKARPSMAVVGNRVARAADGETPKEVEENAHEAIDRGRHGDEAAAEKAAELLADASEVVTVSRSGTVRETVERLDVSVTVAESVPGGEGEDFAAELAADVVPDACIADSVRCSDAVVVGADTVLRDGTVVNKVGSLAAALAADRFGVPVVAVASADKVSPDDGFENEYVGFGGAEVPVFEKVPRDLVEIVTEEGVMSEEEIRERAEDHAALRRSLDLV